MSQLDHVATYAQPKREDPNSSFTDLDVAVTIRRVIGGLFDGTILAIVLVALLRTYGLVTHTFVLRLPLYGRVPDLPKYWSGTLFYLRPAPLFLFLAIAISYFTVFEAALGWTPGKLLVGIRVVDFYGDYPSVNQALIRNIFRILDAYPFVIPNLVGIAIVLSNRRRQRGGDKAAGTLVVDKGASNAVRAVRRWKERQALPDAVIPEEVWT